MDYRAIIMAATTSTPAMKTEQRREKKKDFVENTRTETTHYAAFDLFQSWDEGVWWNNNVFGVEKARSLKTLVLNLQTGLCTIKNYFFFF